MFKNYYFPELKKKKNCFHVSELVDVFGHKSNVSIVMDFMDTDLEVIIKDPTIILSPANIKSYILQTLQVMWSRKLLISVAEPETVWRSGWDDKMIKFNILNATCILFLRSNTYWLKAN